MYPENLVSPIKLERFSRLEGVADMIYNPARTLLLLDAERLGIKRTNGLSMLVAQAKKACELFLDVKIDDGEIDRIVSLIENETMNIVLVGMPGCGKSTVASLISKMTGRELIDTDGLVIRAYTANGHIDIDNGFEVSPEKFREDGRQTVTVSFGGKSCSFTVTVEDSNTLKSIAMASLPTRREYAVGDSVDVSGMSLRLIYGGRSELVNEGFDYSPKELLSPGPQEITVTYAGHSIKFSINVKDKAASPSPKPSASQTPVPTAAPESAQPSETPVRVDRDHQARDVNALVKIIFAVAVISLIGLAGYIFWMQKKGKR
jgi:hypothetical protein